MSATIFDIRARVVSLADLEIRRRDRQKAGDRALAELARQVVDLIAAQRQLAALEDAEAGAILHALNSATAALLSFKDR